MDELGKRLEQLDLDSTDTTKRLSVFKGIYDPMAPAQPALSTSTDKLVQFSKPTTKPLATSLTVAKQEVGRASKLARSQ